MSEQEFSLMTPALTLMVLKGCGEHLHEDGVSELIKMHDLMVLIPFSLVRNVNRLMHGGLGLPASDL